MAPLSTHTWHCTLHNGIVLSPVHMYSLHNRYMKNIIQRQATHMVAVGIYRHTKSNPIGQNECTKDNRHVKKPPNPQPQTPVTGRTGRRARSRLPFRWRSRASVCAPRVERVWSSCGNKGVSYVDLSAFTARFMVPRASSPMTFVARQK